LPLLYWDASARAKRYIGEIGSDAVDALFALVPASQMTATVLGYAEIYSIMIRTRNRGSITLPAFLAAKASLRNEIVNDPDFTLLTVDDAAIFAGVALMEQHNVNATDAAILSVFLRYTQALPPAAPASLLVAADQRLLAAARAEGLSTLNPETVPVANLPTLLASL
jgi:predicted nucleic acid-binding protein